MGRLHVFLCLVLLVSATSAQKGKKNSIKKEDGKIVGGEDAQIENFPYQVSLQNNGEHFCGGSLITPEHVLTAAHCLANMRASRMTVVAGVTKLSDKSRHVYKVKKIISHPRYNSGTFDNDVGLLVLQESVKLGDNVKIAKLSHKDFNPDYSLVVTGWGVKFQGDKASDHLQMVKVDGMSRETCGSRYAGLFMSRKITSNMICAGMDGKGGKDACQGDSGGPAMTTENGTQAGVVSWGFGCGWKNHPGVYARVDRYIPWIRENCGYNV